MRADSAFTSLKTSPERGFLNGFDHFILIIAEEQELRGIFRSVIAI